jgi:hypothetical protein
MSSRRGRKEIWGEQEGMNKKLIIFIFWLGGFLLGMVAYLAVTRLPTAISSPIDPGVTHRRISEKCELKQNQHLIGFLSSNFELQEGLK